MDSRDSAKAPSSICDSFLKSGYERDNSTWRVSGRLYDLFDVEKTTVLLFVEGMKSFINIA